MRRFSRLAASPDGQIAVWSVERGLYDSDNYDDQVHSRSFRGIGGEDRPRLVWRPVVAGEEVGGGREQGVDPREQRAVGQFAAEVAL